MADIQPKTKPFYWVHIILIVLTLQSCTMVKVSVSDQRNPIPQTLKLNEILTITTWGAIKVNTSDFFPSSFQIVCNGHVSYIDPVEVDPSEKADVIYITHAHPDHYSPSTIANLAKPETQFICAKGVAKKLLKQGYNVTAVVPGDVIELNGTHIEAVPAYNTKTVFLWFKAHPKSKQNVGFILDFGQGLRLYHAGDTDAIPEMNKIRDISVALVPIGGDNLTMNIDEAAQIVNGIQPEQVIPMHYELGNKADLTKFKTLVEDGIKVTTLD
ncbi:MBL fold metallo-hydrolase [uncultured Croceitalea sp.]|uniref:MBL fold metallo-hydrolase n=1 Tax=uncultured Croceitalea sp. TaxID=1798908 RepID=UPI0033062078